MRRPVPMAAPARGLRVIELDEQLCRSPGWRPQRAAPGKGLNDRKTGRSERIEPPPLPPKTVLYQAELAFDRTGRGYTAPGHARQANAAGRIRIVDLPRRGFTLRFAPILGMLPVSDALLPLSRFKVLD